MNGKPIRRGMVLVGVAGMMSAAMAAEAANTLGGASKKVSTRVTAFSAHGVSPKMAERVTSQFRTALSQNEDVEVKDHPSRVKTIVYGSVFLLGTRIGLESHIINVDSGELLCGTDMPCDSEDQIERVAVNLAADLLKKIRDHDKIQQAPKKRKNLLIFNFDTKNVSPGAAFGATALIRSAMLNTGNFLVVGPAAAEMIMREPGFIKAGPLTQESALEMGRLMNVGYIMMGDVVLSEGKIRVTARLVNVEAGTVEMSQSGTCPREEELPETIHALVEQFVKDHKEAKKIPMAVMDFLAPGVPAALAASAASSMEGGFFNSGRFEVIPSSRMQAIMKEQGWKGRPADEGIGIEVGRMLNVRYVSRGSMSGMENTWTLAVKVMDVNTGKTVFEKTAVCTQEELPRAAVSLAESFRPAE